MHRTFRSFAVLLFGLLAACAGPSVYTSVDPDADFDRYRSFSFSDRLGTDDAEYQSLLTKYLKQSTAQELEARGYVRDESDPDLIVNFAVHSKDRVRRTSAPTTFYGFRGYGGYGTWGGYVGYDTRVDTYTEETVTIDLVDRDAMQLVWEGTIVARVTESRLKNVRKTVRESVARVFEEFPFRAPGGATGEPGDG